MTETIDSPGQIFLRRFQAEQFCFTQPVYYDEAGITPDCGAIQNSHDDPDKDSAQPAMIRGDWG